MRRPLDDVLRDPRLENTKALKGVPYTRDGYTVANDVDMVDLVEIRDAKYRTVMVLAPTSDRSSRILYQGPDALQARRFPYFEMVFNPDDEVFWGVPDAQILQPYQLEMNEIRTQTMKHRRLALIKWMGRKNVMDEAAIAKLYEEDVAAYIEIEGNPRLDIEKVQVANIPQDLIQAGAVVQSDIREALGFSRNQMGEFQTRRGDTSATEAQAVRDASEIRMDERRDTVADLMTSVVTEIHELLFDHWTEEQVVEVVGPGGVPVWVRVQPALLKAGRYIVNIDPDTQTPRTRQEREAKAVALYDILKDNSLIDPAQLTQYLLREMEGVDMDELMIAMPPQGGTGTPGTPVDPGQLASMLQQGVGQLQANPQALLPAGNQ